MTSRNELDRTIAAARAALEKDTRGLVPRAQRIAIYRAMGPSERAPAGGTARGALKTVGLRRRWTLSTTISARVLPIWERFFQTRDPHDMLEVSRAYMAGETEWLAARSRQREFSGGLKNAYTAPPDAFHAVYVGHAAVRALVVALVDEDMEDEQMKDDEFEVGQWDSALMACAAEAGDLPWGPKWDLSAAMPFWNWFLDDAVPAAYASQTNA